MPAQYQSGAVCLGEFRLDATVESDSEEDLQITKPRRCLSVASLVLSIATVILLYNINRANLNPSLDLEQMNCSCGTSIAEALSKDCKYDSISTAWYPSACRDDNAIAEFNRAGPGINGSWAYYGQNDDELLTVEQVSLLAEKAGDEALFWTTHEWHLAQCLFYWKKEVKARNLSQGRDKQGDDESRIAHCIAVMETHRPLDEINTVSRAILS